MKHKDIDQAMAAKERAELYFASHPGSPAAVCRPELSIRSGRWVALLGRSTEDGIVGVGSTVETAFRAFDAQYLAALRPSVARAALNAESAAFRKRASPSTAQVSASGGSVLGTNLRFAPLRSVRATHRPADQK